MAGINITGTAGASGQGGGGPKSVRGAAWDAYQADLRASQAADAKKEQQIDAAYSQRQAAADKAGIAMKSQFLRQQADSRRAEAALLKDELRVSETIARRQARAAVESARVQRIKGRAEAAGYRTARTEADYENRNHDLRERKKQRAADTEFRMSRAEAEAVNARRDRENPYAYAAKGVGSLGARGAHAIREGDPIRALGYRARLFTTERAARKKAAAGGAQATNYLRIAEEAAAGRAEMGGADVAGSLAFGGVGRAVPYAFLAYKGAQFAWNAPSALNSTAKSLMDQARPYNDLIRGTADVGAGGHFASAGYNADGSPAGGSLADRLTSRDTLSWRRRFGVTGADALAMVNAYGVAPGSAKAAEGIARNAAGASFAPYLQGAFSGTQLAGMAGGYSSLAGPHGGSDMDYYRNLQKVMETAMARGLDKSRVADIITRVQDQTAAAGGAVSMSASSDLVNRMASVGNSGVRSGAGIVALNAALSSSISGLGFAGNSLGNLAIAKRIKTAGMPNTKERLETFLGGRKREDMSASEQAEFDDALSQAKSGSTLGFAHVASGLLQSSEGRQAFFGMARDYAASSGLPKSLQPAMVAGMIGSDIGSTYSALTGGVGDGKGSRASKAGMGWADFGDGMQASIMGAAQRNGIPPAVLAGLIRYEDPALDPNAKSGTGALGYGQVTRSTFNDYKSKGFISAGYKYEDVTDPIKGPEIAAEILKQKQAEGGGTLTEGLRRYHGLTTDKNGVGPDEYLRGVGKSSLSYANLPSVQLATDANYGQGIVDRAKQEAPLANAVGEGPGKVLVEFDAAAGTFSQAVSAFVHAVANMGSSAPGGAAPANNAAMGKTGAHRVGYGEPVHTP